MIKFLKTLFSSNSTTTNTTTLQDEGQQEGTVKFFNYRKGFGFITLKDSEDEIFVHKSNLKTKIKQGNQVTFTIEQSDKGPVAANVKKAGKRK